MSCYGINKENKCYAEVYTMEESKMMAYKPNLLLNGDFKVNQGGQLVYENPAYTAQDSIDKWKIMAGKVNTSFVNYLTIESYNETGSSYFLQNFDSEKSGDFVISLKVLNINKGSFRVYFEGTNQQDAYTISSKGIYKITFRDVKNATGVCLALDNFSGDIEYIRLDEGTVPLPHMKEDYEIALTRCGVISELNKNLNNNIGFPNYLNVLDDTSLKSRGASYTATENCWVIGSLLQDDISTAAILYVDDTLVQQVRNTKEQTSGYFCEMNVMVPVKKGSIVTTRSNAGTYNLKVYAML